LLWGSFPKKHKNIALLANKPHPPMSQYSLHSPQACLKELKNKSQTTLDLEESLNESRYNLYHHLEVLEKQGIIQQEKEGKLKKYKLRKGVTPIILEIDRLKPENYEEFRFLLNKILKLWSEEEIKNIKDIDEVLIVPSTEKK